MRSERGIGLAEVLALASLATLAITATAMRTLPGLWIDDTRLDAERLYTYLQLARVEAVARERSCELVVDEGSRRLRVVDAAGTVLHEAELAREVRLVGASGVPTARFDGRGRIAGTPRTFEITDGATSWTVAVLESGELRRASAQLPAR